MFRSIKTEVEYLDKKKGQGLMKGVAGADEDTEELFRCYRRIEGLFRRLQVSKLIIFVAWSVTTYRRMLV